MKHFQSDCKVQPELRTVGIKISFNIYNDSARQPYHPHFMYKRTNRLRDVRSLDFGQANLFSWPNKSLCHQSLHQVTTSQFLHSQRIKMNKKSREGCHCYVEGARKQMDYSLCSEDEGRWSHPTLSCTDHVV